MERHKVFGLEGLDGTGKSTAGRMLAEETGSRYMYFADYSRLATVRRYFDNAPSIVRFLYYVGVAVENYHYLEEARRMDDVLLDRTIFSTLVYAPQVAYIT